MNQQRPQEAARADLTASQPSSVREDAAPRTAQGGSHGHIRVVRAYLVQDQDGRTLDRLTSVILLQNEWRALTKPQREALAGVPSGMGPGRPAVNQRLVDRGLVDLAERGGWQLTTFGEAVLAYRPDRTEGDQP